MTGPAIIAATSLVPMKWFPDRQTPLATSLATLAIPIGTLFSLTLTTVLSANMNSDDP